MGNQIVVSSTFQFRRPPAVRHFPPLTCSGVASLPLVREEHGASSLTSFQLVQEEHGASSFSFLQEEHDLVQAIRGNLIGIIIHGPRKFLQLMPSTGFALLSA